MAPQVTFLSLTNKGRKKAFTPSLVLGCYRHRLSS